MVFGLEPTASIPEIAAEYIKRTSGKPIPPKLVDKSQAPCKENILLGDDVDLFKLGPWFHMVVVVDDTVDIYNFKQVIHALSTRCHPKKGIHIWDGVGTPVNPFADSYLVRPLRTQYGSAYK
ncbi:MAG: UbiD family decarboxylase [Thermincola sp.]|jgi:3-polyprenyl-4-hydroxybenzoate decarboxylase|nr:UbiD family decarboxylase [Thermincola sp.]MDT3701502.1 UbiD family decarboxylase [Thermincola sp.]